MDSSEAGVTTVFESLAGLPYQECGGKYRRVREIVNSLTQDEATQDRIYKVLWRYGGRCDCTVARNVVALPQVRSSVAQEVQALLASP